MKHVTKILGILALLCASSANAQLYIVCQTGSILCNTTAAPSIEHTGDEAWLAYGKSNANEAQLVGVGGIIKGTGSTIAKAGASDIIGTFTGSVSTSNFLRSDGTLAAPPGSGGINVPLTAPGTVNVAAVAPLALTGIQSIDGVSGFDGEIVLLAGQSTASQNGPQVMHSGAWARPAWWFTGGAPWSGITAINVLGGTVYSGSSWQLTTTGTITIDTTATAWAVSTVALNANTTAPCPAGQVIAAPASTSGGVGCTAITQQYLPGNSVVYETSTPFSLTAPTNNGSVFPISIGSTWAATLPAIGTAGGNASAGAFQFLMANGGTAGVITPTSPTTINLAATFNAPPGANVLGFADNSGSPGNYFAVAFPGIGANTFSASQTVSAAGGGRIYHDTGTSGTNVGNWEENTASNGGTFCIQTLTDSFSAGHCGLTITRGASGSTTGLQIASLTFGYSGDATTYGFPGGLATFAGSIQAGPYVLAGNFVPSGAGTNYTRGFNSPTTLTGCTASLGNCVGVYTSINVSGTQTSSQAAYWDQAGDLYQLGGNIVLTGGSVIAPTFVPTGTSISVASGANRPGGTGLAQYGIVTNNAQAAIWDGAQNYSVLGSVLSIGVLGTGVPTPLLRMYEAVGTAGVNGGAWSFGASSNVLYLRTIDDTGANPVNVMSVTRTNASTAVTGIQVGYGATALTLGGGSGTVTVGPLGAGVVTSTSGGVLGTVAAPSSAIVGINDTQTLTNKSIAAAEINSGTVAVANGGTGAATLTGLVLGNGTSAMTTVAAPSGTVVGTIDIQTLTNKSIDASEINSGTLAIAVGGTNTTATPTAGAVAYGTGSAIGYSAAGTTGNVLVSGGTGSPTWSAAPTIAGTNFTVIPDSALLHPAINLGSTLMTLGGTYTNISGLTLTAPVLSLPNLVSYTVSTLPTCNSTTNKYAMAVVTDATSPTYNGALTGGGAVVVPVFCNGTAWTSH